MPCCNARDNPSLGHRGAQRGEVEFVARDVQHVAVGGDAEPQTARCTAVDDVVGTSAAVTDIAAVRDTVGSSLTSVDLAGLTSIELSFAVVLAVGAGGLVFALGFAERRRTYAILTAIGARPRHLRALIFSETAVLGVLGVAAGAVTGSV